MAARRGDGTARLAEGARAEGERLRERHARLVRERGTPVCLVMREGNEADDAPYAMMGGTGAVLYAEGEAAPEDETADAWGECDVLFADGNVEEAVPPNRIAPIAAGTPTPPTDDAEELASWHNARARSHHARGEDALAAAEFAAAAEATKPAGFHQGAEPCLFRAGDAVDVRVDGRWRHGGVVSYVDEDDELADVLFRRGDSDYDTADNEPAGPSAGGDSDDEEEGVSFDRLRHALGAETSTRAAPLLVVHAKALVNAARCHLFASRPAPALLQVDTAVGCLARSAAPGTGALAVLSHAIFVKGLAHARRGDFPAARAAAAELARTGTDASALSSAVRRLARERRASDARLARAVRQFLQELPL